MLPATLALLGTAIGFIVAAAVLEPLIETIGETHASSISVGSSLITVRAG